jgi:pyridoxamine 5'-phosphate oxidase
MMTKHELMTEIDLILDEAKTGVLASTDIKGRPHMRWLTPCVLKDRLDALYALTSKTFTKVQQLDENPHVIWMIQTPLLDKIITIHGKVNLLDNQSIKSEVLEVIGPRLSVFWKVNEDEGSILVLETVIEEAVYFRPMHGTKQQISFS